MIRADEPVFFCIAVSTKRLCEIRHISARIVISRISNGSVDIMAIGPYKGMKILVINTTADSPGKPIRENAGERNIAIWAIIPQYCRKLTIKLIGRIIFKSHQMVLPALGSADFELVKSRLVIVFILWGI